MTSVVELAWKFFSKFFPKSVTTLVTAGVVVNQQPIDVSGCYYYAVQISGIDGSDSYKIQGSVNGSVFADITGLTALTANGITQFTGIYEQLKAVKNSGNGTGAKVVLRCRP